MVEMLPNPDTNVAPFRHCFRKLVLEMSCRFPAVALVVALAASPLGGAATDGDFEKQIEAAIHREIVLGDLAGAMEQYRAILAEPGVTRPVAARALLETGECLERLGKGKEAYNTYLRVVGEYGDQAAIVSRARTRLNTWSGPRNLKFEEGVPGKVPPGWVVPSFPKDANYVAELVLDGCRSRSGCAVVTAPVNVPGMDGNLMQQFGAAAYRGKTVRLRAWLRLDQFFAVAPGGVLRIPDPKDRDSGQLWLRVERGNRRTGFAGNLEQPVRSSDWTRGEVTGAIDDDAQFISFGVTSIGGGRVWIDDVSFEIVNR